MWVCEWCISSQVCIVTVLSVCISDDVVCVVTSDWGLLLVYLFVTEVTNPYDWSVFVCGPGFDSTSHTFVRNRVSQAAGSDGRLAQNRNWAPISRGCVNTICADAAAFQPRSGCVFIGMRHGVDHYQRLHEPSEQLRRRFHSIPRTSDDRYERQYIGLPDLWLKLWYS